jgi:hypothetical protein
LYFSVVAVGSCFFGVSCDLFACIVKDGLGLLEKVLGLLCVNLFKVALLIAVQDLIYAFWTSQGDLGAILHLKLLCFDT